MKYSLLPNYIRTFRESTIENHCGKILDKYSTFENRNGKVVRLVKTEKFEKVWMIIGL